MKFGARTLTGEELKRYWPQIDNARAYPTATAAVEKTACRGYSVLVCRLAGPTCDDGGTIVNLSFQQVLSLCQDRKLVRVKAGVRCSPTSLCVRLVFPSLRRPNMGRMPLPRRQVEKPPQVPPR